MKNVKFKHVTTRVVFALWIVVVIFCYSACASYQYSGNRHINSLLLQDSLFVDIQVDKISYHPSSRTFFLMNRQENSIHVYRNGTTQNIIGRSGFGNDNFRRLSDICFGVDGFLYALDSFDRTIKKFDTDGRYIGQASINQISSPEKFVMTQFGSFFVYDGHSKEIINLDAFDYSTKFTFGRFQINSVDEMSLVGDYLNIFDRERNISDVFVVFGMMENTYRGYFFYDAFRNPLTVRGGDLIDMRSRTERRIHTFPSPPDMIFIENNLFYYRYHHQIKVFRILYEAG